MDKEKKGHIKVAGIYEQVELDVNPNKNLNVFMCNCSSCG